LKIIVEYAFNLYYSIHHARESIDNYFVQKCLGSKFSCTDDTPQMTLTFCQLLYCHVEEHRGCFERARARAVLLTLAWGRPEFG